MMPATASPSAAQAARSDQLLQAHLLSIHKRTDRLFAGLMFAQWLACIAASIWISPQTWAGTASSTHIHVWAAILLGGAICIFPILLAVFQPGRTTTRHLIACGQMLTSALLIHLMGGRIETHFHVFGSLALLAAYRDWRVLVTSTIVVTLDHSLRGILWPESVYGVLSAAPWRTLEHAGWVIFEDAFLFITIRQSMQEMRDIAGQRAMLEASHQVTEQQVASRTADLRRAEERLQLIIDNVPNGVVMVDETGLIRLTNPVLEEMFGYSSSDLLGQPIEMLVPENIRERHPSYREAYVQAPEARRMGSGRDLNGVRKGGSEFPVELGLSSLQTDEGTFVLAAVVDISERKRTELALQEHASQLEAINKDLNNTKSQLENKNRELDEFTYVASHDLQEPVRKLVSFSKLLEQDVGDALGEQAQRDLHFIVDAASRMRQLIQDLLALSRAGRSAMKSVPVSLEACVQQALSALQIRLEETSAEVEVEDLPTVLGDPTMLTQLYQNLIGNALKFTSDKTPRIAVTADHVDGELTLGVRDNGIGMKPEHAERIFKPFQRLHRRGEYEGTGIGLSICKKNVERHGGNLWVESELGEGSLFKFTLPESMETTTCRTEQSEELRLQSC